MATAKDRVFQMRVDTAFLAKIDDWRRHQPDLPPRAEAIRRLVESALTTGKAPPTTTARPAKPSAESPAALPKSKVEQLATMRREKAGK